MIGSLGTVAAFVCARGNARAVHATPPSSMRATSLRKKGLGNRLAALPARSSPAEQPPVGAVGRVLGVAEPHRRRPAKRADRLLRSAGAATYVEDRGCATTGCSSSAGGATGPTLAAEYPRFRMNDDREVSCYALLADHLAGKDVKDCRPLAAWFAAARTRRRLRRCWPPRCYDARKLGPSRRLAQGARLSDRCQQAARAPGRRRRCMVRRAPRASVAEPSTNPARYLARKRRATPRNERRAERRWRSCAWPPATPTSPRAVAAERAGTRRCPPTWLPGPGRAIGRQAAQKLLPDAADHFTRAARCCTGKDGSRVHRPGPTRRWPGRFAARRAARRRPAALAAGGAGHQRHEPGRAARRRPGSTGRRAA